MTGARIALRMNPDRSQTRPEQSSLRIKKSRRKKSKKYFVYVRIDLVRRVSADHVMNGEVATGVLVEPVIELQRTVLVDDNEVPICNQTLDFSRGNDAVAVHRGGHDGRSKAPRGLGEMRTTKKYVEVTIEADFR